MSRRARRERLAAGAGVAPTGDSLIPFGRTPTSAGHVMRRADCTPTSAARRTLLVALCLAALLQQTWTAAHLAQHAHLPLGVATTTQRAHGHDHGGDPGAHPTHGSARAAHHHAADQGSADTAPRGSRLALTSPPAHDHDHVPHDEADHGARHTAPGSQTPTGGAIDRAAPSVLGPWAPTAPRIVAIRPSECWPRPPPERSSAAPRAPPTAA